MKFLIFAILAITGVQAQAGGFSGDSYSNDQLRFNNRCGIPVCRSNDRGRRYVEYCDFRRQSIIPSEKQPVYVWRGDDGSSCYCPCDYQFEWQVTKLD